MEKKKLLSVIVPTKDRYKYLYHLVRLVKDLNSDEIELVIQDNSEDNREFFKFLDENKFPFIHYDYHKGQLPMSINADKAILNSTGEYICFIGDDDGVTKYAISGAKWMKENKIDAVRCTPYSYFWPDANQGLGCNETAELRYQKFTGKVKMLNAQKELYSILGEGIPDPGKMAMVYHSIVNRKVLDRIYEKCGTYFPGQSPDISNAVALSLVVDRFALVSAPWAISGHSVYKGGGVGVPGRKYPPEISDMPWFRPDAEKTWYYRIPRIAVGETIWPESAISALIAMGREDLVSKVNFNRLYARFMLKRSTLKHMVKPVCQNMTAVKLMYLRMIIEKYVSALFRRIGWKLGIGKFYHVYGINDIIEARKELEKLSSGELK